MGGVGVHSRAARPRECALAVGASAGNAPERLLTGAGPESAPVDVRFGRVAKRARILIVDDDVSSSVGLDELLVAEGYAVEVTRSGRAALERASVERPDVVITDLRMPEMDGIELIRRLRTIHATLPIIVLTAYADVRSAVEAIRSGAIDYLPRPVDVPMLLDVVQSALTARASNAAPRGDSVLGRSEPVQRVLELAKRVASTNTTVLLSGETGTGKGLLARRLHDLSTRAAAPFVVVHCASFAETLLESELFGHERGAFTGAIRKRVGRFEQAHGGTMFLDEIGEISLATQVKLLRVLQDRIIERVGGSHPMAVDVRIIAATNRDLVAEVAAGRFRRDLYYRLNVFPIEVPPLRDRGDDVVVLAEHFLRDAAQAHGRRAAGFTPSARAKLVAHDWPGNVRELANAVERAVVLCDGHLVDAAQLELADRQPPGMIPRGE